MAVLLITPPLVGKYEPRNPVLWPLPASDFPTTVKAPERITDDSGGSFCFPNRKVIEVKIIDDEEYEKNKAFYIELGDPVLLEIGQKHGGCQYQGPFNTLSPGEANTY